jgi:nucleotide-binding universal stress UspA family protein
MSYKKILIAVDGRENSMTVAKKGFELAEQLNAEVALVYVVDLSKTIRSYEIVNPDLGIYIKESIINQKKDVEDSLNKMLKIFSNGKEVQKFMPEGYPREAILETSKNWGADLIVIGLHGKSGLGIFVMGSISQYISLHSNVPVIIIPS